MKSWTRRLILLTVACTLVSVPTFAQSARAQKEAARAAAAKIDLNTASQADLEALPGVGAATAKKIIAGRPFSSVADLAKAGVSKSTIDKIAAQVTVGSSTAAAAPSRPPASESRAASPKAAPGAPGSAPVDLNTASEKDLEALPGVGPATARKIVAGRPYTSTADLAKAGVSGATIQKISPLVTASASTASRAPRPAPSTPAQPPPSVDRSTPPPAPAPSRTPAPAPSRTPAPAGTSGQLPPSPGMVWVNLDTKIYHREGDRYYGKTKNGKWLTEQEAIAAGYRASKQAPQK